MLHGGNRCRTCQHAGVERLLPAALFEHEHAALLKFLCYVRRGPHGPRRGRRLHAWAPERGQLTATGC